MSATTAPKRKSAGSAPGTTSTVDVHPLADLIPPNRWANSYISRKFGGYLDLDLLEYCKDVRKATLMAGPTGPGKTSLVMAYAASRNVPVVTIACNNGIDPNTLFGSWQPDGNGGMVFIESDLVRVVRDGGILYLDEINFAPPRVMAVLHSLLDARRFIVVQELGNKVIFASEDLQVIAAYNPGYEGTKKLNQAFKNRFATKLRFDYDKAVEAQLLCMPVMLDVADELRNSYKQGVLETPISTNMLIEFEEFCLDINVEFAVENFLNAFLDHEIAAVREVINLRFDRIEEEAKVMRANAV